MWEQLKRKRQVKWKKAQNKSEAQLYGCAKDQRVPAASVCSFGCGVFSVCWSFLLCLYSLDTFSFSPVALGERSAIMKPE